MASPWKKNYSRYRTYFINTLVHYRKRDDTKAYLELLLTSIAIIIFAVFALKPTLTTIGVLSQEISTKESTVGVLDNKISKLSDAQKLLSDNSSSLEKLDISIPSMIEVSDLIRQIEGQTEKNEVFVSFFSVEQGPLYKADLADDDGKNTPLSEKQLLFKLGLIGEYKNITAFINDVQNLRRPVVIDQIRVDDTDKSNQYLNIVINMHVPYLDTESNLQ